MSEENKPTETPQPAPIEPPAPPAPPEPVPPAAPEPPRAEEFYGFDEPPVPPKPVPAPVPEPPAPPKPPVVPEPPVPATPAPTEPDLAEENRLLRLQMLKLDPYAFGEPEPKPTGTPEAPAAPQPAVAPAGDQVPDYLTDEEYDDIFSSKASLNKLLHKVAKSVREETLREVYPVVTQVQERYREAEKAINSFYKDNPDLQPYQEHIDVIASGIVAKRPGLPVKQILELASKQVRPLVRANKVAPGFAKPGSVAQPQTPPKLTEFEKDSKDLFS